MVNKTENWSKHWKSSTNPTKQRKYRNNAPQHVKDKFLSVNLSKELREYIGRRNLTVRVGDRLQVMRGDDKGKEGIISKINLKNGKIYLNTVEDEATDGTRNKKPLEPSNLQLQKLNLSDPQRAEKFGVEDLEEIKVDEDEIDEAIEDEEDEMMKQMQGGGDSGAHEEDDEDKEDEQTETETAEEKQASEESHEDEEETNSDTQDLDHEEIVSGTISDAKKQIEEIENPDFEALLEAEKQGKNRKTLIEHLEQKTSE